MSATWPTVLVLFFTAPWWVPLARTLYEELRDASEPVEPFPALAPVSSARRRARPLAADTRVPLNRVLAFRGPDARIRARRRWEGGFGRRGL